MHHRFAVIGNPIQHSLSPMIHQQFAEQFEHQIDYQKQKLEPDHLNSWVMHFFKNGGCGLNVTLPFKTLAFELAKNRTDDAMRAQAVNTLWFSNGELFGDNTDGRGLIHDLKRHLVLKDMNILVLGAGGAAKGIIPALLLEKPKALTVANRTFSKACDLQQQFKDIEVANIKALQGVYDLVINSTSMGLNGEWIDLTQELWQNAPFCYDLVYNLEENTPFVENALAHHCQAQDGLGMLVEQAAESYLIWQGVKPDVDSVLIALKKGLNHRA